MRRVLWGAFLLVVLGGSARAALLRDIAGHPYRESVQELVERGIVQGYADGTFKPDAPINRAEFLKILMLAVFGEEAFAVTSTACFFDFGREVEWYYPHACIAKDLGIINGYPDGTFRGERTVNLVEALKMSLDAWDVPLPGRSGGVGQWYDPYVVAAAAAGVFRTLPLVPDFPLTRGEAAELLVRLGQPLQAMDPGFAEEQLRVLMRRDLEDAIRQRTTPDPICGNGTLERGEQCDDGNTENDDGCSEICVVVPQPVRHGVLRIEQRPLGSLSVARGAKDVLLLAFEAIAGRQNVFITQLKFTAGTGSLNSGRNYRLYYDRDGDGRAETHLGTAVPQDDVLTYIRLNIPVQDGFYTRVEVRGDVALSGTVGDFSLEFLTGEPDYVEGVDALDGEDVSGIETDGSVCQTVSICWVSVYTDAPRLVSVGTQGSLFVTQDSVPVRSRQLLAGVLSDVLLRLRFRATGEDITVTKISISGGNDSIDALELYEEDASSPFATARASACRTVSAGSFCADTDLPVPRDAEKRIAVRARVHPDTMGAASGDTARLVLAAETTGNVAVEAWGESSLVELNQNNGNATAEGEIIIGRDSAGQNSAIQGSTHDIVASKIASISNVNPDADGSPVPAGLATFAVFRFAALPHENTLNGLNDVVITSITFSVTATNVEFDSSSFELFNSSNAGVAVSCSGGTTGVFSVTCSGLAGSAVSTAVAQGSSIDLALRATITNPQVTAGTSTLQVQLNGLGNRGGGGPVVWNDEVSVFQWVDGEEAAVRSTLYRMQ